MDAISPLRSRIDEPCHPVREAEGGAVFDARGVAMDVDQTRHDDLASRIDGFRRVLRNVGPDGRDAAIGDRHVADCVKPERRIEHAPALDDQVVPRCCREDVEHAGEHSRARSGCPSKLAPVHHHRRPPELLEERFARLHAVRTYYLRAPDGSQEHVRFNRPSGRTPGGRPARQR